MMDEVIHIKASNWEDNFMKDCLMLSIVSCIFIFTGCSGLKPELSPEEKALHADAQVPFQRETLFHLDLIDLGKAIEENDSINYKTVFQSQKTSLLLSSGGELPYDITEMIATAVGKIAGQTQGKVGYSALNYDAYIKDKMTGGKSTRTIPAILLSANFTEFDKNIKQETKGYGGDLLVGGGKAETDLGLDLDSSQKITRITLDFRLINYRNNIAIPGLQVSNTVLVYHTKKRSRMGFVISGSGVNRKGSISVLQGTHQAVRNLVELSVLQLFSKFYRTSYLRAYDRMQIGEPVFKNLRKSFEHQRRRSQVSVIQRLLVKLEVEGKKLTVDGRMGPLTRNKIDLFLKKYNIDISPDDLPSVYVWLKYFESRMTPETVDKLSLNDQRPLVDSDQRKGRM